MVGIWWIYSGYIVDDTGILMDSGYIVDILGKFHNGLTATSLGNYG